MRLNNTTPPTLTQIGLPIKTPMLKRISQLLLFLWLTAITCITFAQESPYTIRWAPGIALTGAGVGSFVAAEHITKRTPPLSKFELDRLRVQDIRPALDRFAVRQTSAFAKTTSDATLYGSMALPLTMLAGNTSRDNFGQVAFMYAQVFSLTYGISDLVKNTARRTRPYAYNEDAPMSLRQSRDARRSFFSGHTSLTAANAFFTARAYADLYPEAGAKPVVWASAAVLPTVTGLSRVFAGKHYWTDVLVGYVVGAGVGLLVPEVYK